MELFEFHNVNYCQLQTWRFHNQLLWRDLYFKTKNKCFLAWYRNELYLISLNFQGSSIYLLKLFSIEKALVSAGTLSLTHIVINQAPLLSKTINDFGRNNQSISTLMIFLQEFFC